MFKYQKFLPSVMIQRLASTTAESEELKHLTSAELSASLSKNKKLPHHGHLKTLAIPFQEFSFTKSSFKIQRSNVAASEAILRKRFGRKASTTLDLHDRHIYYLECSYKKPEKV